MRVLVVAPRLDTSFKHGLLTEGRAQPIAPIRQHWERAVRCIEKRHDELGDETRVMYIQNWMVTPELIESLAPDLVYVPHRERNRFPLRSNVRALFYMQTVFPWMFSVDERGWGTGSALYPYVEQAEPTGFYSYVRERALMGVSKFDQPESGRDMRAEIGDYVLFPCQLPHDESIRWHSRVSVEDALHATCQGASVNGLSVLVKGHPVNPGSMAPLREAMSVHHNAVWSDDVSIQDAIRGAELVATVNSGVGMEALLHAKPVVTFGFAEYDPVCTRAERPEDAAAAIGDARFDLEKTKAFFDRWYTAHLDTEK